MEHRLPASSSGDREIKRVDVCTQRRYQAPAVRLERRQISMLNPPPAGQPQQQQQQQEHLEPRDKELDETSKRAQSSTAIATRRIDVVAVTTTKPSPVVPVTRTLAAPPAPTTPAAPPTAAMTTASSDEAAASTSSAKAPATTTSGPETTPSSLTPAWTRTGTDASIAIVGEKVPLRERGSSPVPRAPHNGGSPAQPGEEPRLLAHRGSLTSVAREEASIKTPAQELNSRTTRPTVTITKDSETRLKPGKEQLQNTALKIGKEKEETKPDTNQEKNKVNTEDETRQELKQRRKELQEELIGTRTLTELATSEVRSSTSITKRDSYISSSSSSSSFSQRNAGAQSNVAVLAASSSSFLSSLSTTSSSSSSSSAAAAATPTAPKLLQPPMTIIVSPAQPALLEPRGEVKPARLESAQVIEFFVEQAPAEEEEDEEKAAARGLQVAEQSLRQDPTALMEFFEGQPTRQEGVQVSPTPIARQETANVIEFFEEQDRCLEEAPHLSSPRRLPSSLLIVPGTHAHHGGGGVGVGGGSGSLRRGERVGGGAPRSPSPSTLHASVGLHHLDNLIRLMEQLSTLKDENLKLRKKCDYLETTKNLLKARSELMTTSDSSSASAASFYQPQPARRQRDGAHPHHPNPLHPHPHHQHQPHHHHHPHHHGRDSEARGWGGRPRLSSAEDADEFWEISESASDQRPKRSKGAMHKRSFSTGSLEVEILDETSCVPEGRIPKSKSGKSVFSSKSPKQKSKSSKWARVKKVLTGQFLYEDLGTTLKSLKEFGRSPRYTGVGTEGTPHDFPSPPPPPPSSSSPRMPRHPQQQRPLGLNMSLDPELLPSQAHPRHPSSPSLTDLLPTKGRVSVLAASPGAGGGGSGEWNGGEGEPELGTEIWMGPPDWWEQYEASKKGGQNSEASSSDLSSVIEVKTMYLGSGQKDTERLLRVKPLVRRQSSPSLLAKDLGEGEGEAVEVEAAAGRLVHRSSSYKGEEMDVGKIDLQGVVVLSSSPSGGGGGVGSGGVGGGGGIGIAAGGKTSERDSKKLHQKAWGRVKEMIHVRKDSVKKRKREREREREESSWSQEAEETSELDVEGLLEEQLAAEFGEGVVGRSTPRTSPVVLPRGGPVGGNSLGESPPHQFQGLPLSAAAVDVAALLAGSMSEEFAQKMHAWQELQLRKSASFRGPSGEAETEEGPGVECAGEAQELLPPSGSPAETRRRGATPPAESLSGSGEAESGPAPLTPAELLLQGPNVNVEELQRRISESFSRKLQEWERRKYRRPPTPEMEHKGFAKPTRKSSEGGGSSRTKKTREEKERERQEKAREREMQKVEKEQVKLEKEKNRIEKERLRAMERQAKLERMKGRLSQPDALPPGETSLPPQPQPSLVTQTATAATPSSPPSAPRATRPMAQDALAQHRVTADFKKKLSELEQLKEGVSSSSEGPPATGEAQPPPRRSKAGGREGRSRPPPLSLSPCLPESPDERSPIDRASDVSLGDDSTSVTEESLTASNIASLERANSQLLKEVQRKELEYGQLQEEVHKLNAKLDKVRQEHAAEMARFRRELEAGTVTGPVQLEVGELESTVRELEEKIALMENAGDQLAESMESAAIGKWQSIEGEEVVSQQLVEMIDQMKGMLMQATLSSESPPSAPWIPTPPPSATEEQVQKTMALHNFETVYSHAMKLQVQMNNLRVSQLERNKEIMLIKRQLLLQEVNNVLLQAHITRRETELYQYREARRLGTSVRRWNTFSGQGDSEARPPFLRNVSAHDSDQLVQALGLQPASRPSAKPGDQPYVTDEDARLSAAGVEGVTGGGKEPQGTGRPSTVSAPPCPLITTTPATPEKSTDHKEQHLNPPVAVITTPPTVLTPATATSTVGQVAARPGQPAKDPRLQHPPAPVLDSGQKAATTTTKTTTTTASATAGSTRSTSPVASRAETGSPAVLAQTTAPSSVAPAATSPPQTRPRDRRSEPDSDHVKPMTETPVKPIPRWPAEPRADDTLEGERAASAALPLLAEASPATAAPRDANISQTESVMKGIPQPYVDVTKAGGSQAAALPTAPTGGAVDISTSPEQTAPTEAEPQSPKSALRSPVSRQKYLRRQKEERDKKKDRAPGSPRNARIPGDSSGKPPPHPNSTPHQSPSASHRSKSVGDMDGMEADSVMAATTAPLRDVIERFEKRATVCETEERKIEFRKTPSPTLHLPRVGLVSRVRRLKPAAELLEESQRYRSGHSIYATRIMQRYLPPAKPGSAAAAVGPTSACEKENAASGASTSYVQAMVRRLSRESTPGKGSNASSAASSEHSLHRSDAAGRLTHSELVSHLVHKLSTSFPSHFASDASHSPLGSPSLAHRPLQDLTNEGQVTKLRQTFSADGAASERAAPSGATDDTRQSTAVAGLAACSIEGKVDAGASHSSMPMLPSAETEEEDSGLRERAASYGEAESQALRQQQRIVAGGDSIERIAEEFLDPAFLGARAGKDEKISPSSSTKSKNALCCQTSACVAARGKASSSSATSAYSHPPRETPSSPKSGERKGGREPEKKETIRVLCKQSMSFDLGVSLRAQSPETLPRRPRSDEPVPGTSRARPDGDGTEGIEAQATARPASTSSEGDEALSPAGEPGEKKKQRSRFLDSSWLQKPKKFFKVSK